MKLRYFFLAVGLFLVLLPACKQEEMAKKGGFSPAIGERMQMASFKLTSLTDQTELDSSQLEGKVLLVTFFASWCPPCIQEIPTLIELQNSFGRKDFSVVAFSVDAGNLSTLKNLIANKGINYPVLLADPVVTESFGGVTGIPATFLVNRQGQIFKKYLGYVEHDFLTDEIENLLTSR
jgi:thiol-disulfide isomerase/thioredoxin